VTAENVEIVRGGFDALKREGVEGLVPLIHPDFEATTPASLASEPDTYRGPDGVRRYFDSFYDAMEDIYFEGHEFTAVGDRVVVDFTLHATGRSSGIPVEQKAFQVWTLRDGKAIGLDLFTDRDEAMAAAKAG
jgi:ketosteroid isomerase-like protein